MRDTRGPDGLRFARAESDRGHSHDMMDMLAVGGDDPKPPAQHLPPTAACSSCSAAVLRGEWIDVLTDAFTPGSSRAPSARRGNDLLLAIPADLPLQTFPRKPYPANPVPSTLERRSPVL